MNPDRTEARGPAGPPTKPDRWFFYPWEERFERLVSPFEEFIERETTSGLVLIAGTAAALLLANSVFGDAYASLLHPRLGVTGGAWSLRIPCWPRPAECSSPPCSTTSSTPWAKTPRAGESPWPRTSPLPSAPW